MSKLKKEEILDGINTMIPNPVCELNYQKDYELLIAVVLSAQSTDKRVNEVTPILWKKYDLNTLATAKKEDVENIIKPVGTQIRKSEYLIQIAKRLLKEYNGIVPNNREFLEKLPGVGHKTANVFLSEIYDVPAIAVDTHVSRVTKRLEIAKDLDDVIIIERKLMKMFPKMIWSRLHLQLVLFGRYICKAKNPECFRCEFYKKCKVTKDFEN